MRDERFHERGCGTAVPGCGERLDVLTARLARYVATPSVSRQEGAMADLIARELAAAGLAVQRSGQNVWCEIGDAPRPRLLLNSHLDTVPPGSGWIHDPWQPRALDVPSQGQVRDARLVGLGANDAKGCVAAMVEAFLGTQRRLAQGDTLGGTVILALTAEEEISGAGLVTVLPQLGPLDAAIVGEPTALQPMTAQRGLLILRAVSRGRTGHPANTSPTGADNAIMNAAHDLTRLAEFDWGASHAVLGPCHAHVTRVAGGVALNVIPDCCEFWLDIRTTPGEPHGALYERLKHSMAGPGCTGKTDLFIHSDRLMPTDTAPSEAIVQAVLRAVPGTQPGGSPTMSDMVFLVGTPAVKIGPGESARSHTPDEYLTLSELQSGAAAYSRIIMEYFALARSGRPPCRPGGMPASE